MTQKEYQNNYTVKEMKKLCKSRKISGYGKLNEAEIASLLARFDADAEKPKKDTEMQPPAIDVSEVPKDKEDPKEVTDDPQDSQVKKSVNTDNKSSGDVLHIKILERHTCTIEGNRRIRLLKNDVYQGHMAEQIMLVAEHFVEVISDD